jgi:hypothetical protein
MATWMASSFVKRGLPDEGFSSRTRLANTDRDVLSHIISMVEALKLSLKVSWGSV